MTAKLEQGTQAWRAARVGLITGSRIGGILGVSPFATRKTVLREMVDEALGNFSDFTNEPMKWGTDHEDEAAKLYQFLYYPEGELEVVGFYTDGGFMGASPDRFVGDDGMVEIKCPWAISKNKNPEFKSIEDKDMRHYYHQVQCQLYVTGREWCDFFQWTPNGQRCQRVIKKENWFPLNRDWFRDFMTDYKTLLTASSLGGPAERVATSARWGAAVEDYRMACITEAAAKSEKEAAKTILIGLMDDAGIDECTGDGIRVQKVSTIGSVNYAELLSDAGIDADLDEYRKAPTVSYRVKEIKEKK